MAYQAPTTEAVEVTAPARLHLGFVDLNGDLGRRFGSLGLTLEDIVTRVRIEPATELSATGPEAERAHRAAEHLASGLGLPATGHIRVLEAIPGHVGLGSGTQIALAVGTALARLHHQQLETRTIARHLDRGARSSIGIGAFDHGGFIVDGGRGSHDAPPPVIARAAFPAEWRVLLLLDRRGQGLHGQAEVEAFRQLPPFPAEQAGHLCRLLLMQALPALHEGDCDAFGRALREIQQRVGDHFAPAQGGRFTSPMVADALAWLERQGISGVGQSSWGPTGFAVVPDQQTGEDLVAKLRQRCDPRLLQPRLCRPAERGARVHAPTSPGLKLVL